MKNTNFLLPIIAFIFGAILSPVNAHKGTDHRLKIFVQNDQILCEAHLEASQLVEDFDENGDRAISVAEFSNNAANIEAWIDERIQLVAGNGLPVEASYSDAPIENFETLSQDDKVEHIRIIRRYALPSKNEELWLLYNLFEFDTQIKDYVIWQKTGVTRGAITKDAALLRIQ